MLPSRSVTTVRSRRGTETARDSARRRSGRAARWSAARPPKRFQFLGDCAGCVTASSRPPHCGQLYSTSVIANRARHAVETGQLGGHEALIIRMLAVHLEYGASPRAASFPAVRGFARIRLLAAGICSTDLELQRGYYGFRGTPGHEFVGEVTEADRGLAGKRVVGEINLACRDCEWCRRGLGRHCPTRTVLGIVKQPGAFEIPRPADVTCTRCRADPDRARRLLEPLAAACEILDQVDPAERVAVLGDGKLGLLIAQVLQAHGAACICSENTGQLRLPRGGSLRNLPPKPAGGGLRFRGGRHRLRGPARRSP